MSRQPVESARAAYWTGFVCVLAILAVVLIVKACAV